MGKPVVGEVVVIPFPQTNLHPGRSSLHGRQQAFEMYLANNPHNESQFVFAIEEGPWLDPDEGEFVAAGASELKLRGRTVKLPALEEYARHGIELEHAPRVQVFELCRFLAATQRDLVLATPTERRISVLPEMEKLLQLEEWRHPDLAAGELPTQSETFRQLAKVVETGDTTLYRPSEPPNTHWRNWPEGGRY